MSLSIPYSKIKISFSKATLSASVLWLFMLSALIGVSLGFEQWFASKTPLNLIVQLALLYLMSNFKKLSDHFYITLVFVLGMTAEWVGVSTGWPFGEYAYGPNLGVKIAGVPLLIGFNWAMLSWCTYSIFSTLKWPKIVRYFLGSLFMVLLDFPMEIVAPEFGLWKFETMPPWNNYLAWGILAFLMQFIVDQSKTKVDTIFSFNLLLSQIVFFSYLAVLYSV